jgi:hypothetical protein
VKTIACLLILAGLAAPALAAEPLEFSSEPGPALNIARTLMGEERGAPLHDDEIAQVALIDLDGDGTRDIFAFADSSYFCGTAGCVPRLYRLDRDTGQWHELPIESDTFLNGDPSMWSVGDKGPNGWLELKFTTSDIRIALTWNGSAYSN